MGAAGRTDCGSGCGARACGTTGSATCGCVRIDGSLAAGAMNGLSSIGRSTRSGERETRRSSAAISSFRMGWRAGCACNAVAPMVGCVIIAGWVCCGWPALMVGCATLGAAMPKPAAGRP